jgi:hypothetical protein
MSDKLTYNDIKRGQLSTTDINAKFRDLKQQLEVLLDAPVGVAEDEIIEMSNTDPNAYQIATALNTNPNDPLYVQYKNKYLYYTQQNQYFNIHPANWNPAMWEATQINTVTIPQAYADVLQTTMGLYGTSIMFYGLFFPNAIVQTVQIVGGVAKFQGEFLHVGIKANKSIELVLQKTLNAGNTFTDVEVLTTLTSDDVVKELPTKLYDLTVGVASPVTQIGWRIIARTVDGTNFSTVTLTDSSGNVVPVDYKYMHLRFGYFGNSN